MIYVALFILGFLITFFSIIGMYRYLDATTQYGLKAENYIHIVMVSTLGGMTAVLTWAS
jgi:hypothetical protein